MAKNFLFTAEFADGTVYHQNEQDKSIYGGANCFSDIQGKKIRKFIMHGGGQIYTLDLVFGSLTINDNPPIWPPDEVYPGMPMKLIYQRITQDRITNTVQAQKSRGLLFWKPVEVKTSKFIEGYIIGYEFPRRGKSNGVWTLKIQVDK